MSIYNLNGGLLQSAYNRNGEEIKTAYDRHGNIVFQKSDEGQVLNSFSVLGDSYSTYEGYTDHPWYPANGNLTSVDQTWWKLFESRTGIQLMKNESYSGSCICYDGYSDGTADQKEVCFLGRMNKVGYPQYLFIFGGTNDSWVPVRVGEYKYSDWTEADKEYFRPALAYLIATLKETIPNTELIFIKNTGLSSGISGSIDTICQHYGIEEIVLTNIDKSSGHPTVTGMQQIASQIIAAMDL